MHCPLTPYEASWFCALRLGATPSLRHSSCSTLRSILTTFTLELSRYFYCDLALRLCSFSTAFFIHLQLRLWLWLRLHLRSLTIDLRLQLRLCLRLRSTSPCDFDCDCVLSLLTPSLPHIPQTRTLLYMPYLPTSSLCRQSTRIQHLAHSALASASYHSQILPLTARFGVCSVLVSFRQEQAHQQLRFDWVIINILGVGLSVGQSFDNRGNITWFNRSYNRGLHFYYRLVELLEPVNISSVVKTPANWYTCTQYMDHNLVKS